MKHLSLILALACLFLIALSALVGSADLGLEATLSALMGQGTEAARIIDRCGAEQIRGLRASPPCKMKKNDI